VDAAAEARKAAYENRFQTSEDTFASGRGRSVDAEV
jgi:hypothetical protein